MWRHVELGFGIGYGRHIKPEFVGRLSRTKSEMIKTRN
jgi:hypothetical protein